MYVSDKSHVNASLPWNNSFMIATLHYKTMPFKSISIVQEVRIFKRRIPTTTTDTRAEATNFRAFAIKPLY